MSLEKETQKPEIKKDWRYYLGLFFFIIHLILPILALIIVPVLGLSTGGSTLLYGLSVAGGPDVLLQPFSAKIT